MSARATRAARAGTYAACLLLGLGGCRATNSSADEARRWLEARGRAVTEASMVSNRSAEVARALIRAGISPDARDRAGWPVLVRAVGHPEFVQALLEGGADVDLAAPGGRTALMAAAEWSCLEHCLSVVQHLLAANPRLEQRDEQGRTALLHAAAANNAIVLELLARAGADLNARDPRGVTALMTSAAKGRPETLKRLIELGADLDLTDAEGYSALMYAARVSSVGPVARLVQAGANVSFVGSDGRSALSLAGAGGHAERLLRSAGAQDGVFFDTSRGSEESAEE